MCQKTLPTRHLVHLVWHVGSPWPVVSCKSMCLLQTPPRLLRRSSLASCTSMDLPGSLSSPIPPVLMDQGTSFSWFKTVASWEKKVKKIIQKTLQRNVYFTHPGAILLSMLEDSNKAVRAQPVNTILTICMKANNSFQELDNEALAPSQRS